MRVNIKQGITSKSYVLFFSVAYMVFHAWLTVHHPAQRGQTPMEQGIRLSPFPIQVWSYFVDGIFYLLCPFLVAAAIAWLVHVLSKPEERNVKSAWFLLAAIYTSLVVIMAYTELH